MDIFWLVALLIFFNSLAHMMQGVLKSMNLQWHVITISIILQVLVNYTLIWLLGFHYDFKQAGIMGAAVAYNVSSILVYIIHVERQDWSKQAADV